MIFFIVEVRKTPVYSGISKLAARGQRMHPKTRVRIPQKEVEFGRQKEVRTVTPFSGQPNRLDLQGMV